MHSGKVGMNLYSEQSCNMKIVRFVTLLYRGRDIGQLSLPALIPLASINGALKLSPKIHSNGRID